MLLVRQILLLLGFIFLYLAANRVDVNSSPVHQAAVLFIAPIMLMGIYLFTNRIFSNVKSKHIYGVLLSLLCFGVFSLLVYRVAFPINKCSKQIGFSGTYSFSDCDTTERNILASLSFIAVISSSALGYKTHNTINPVSFSKNSKE